MKPLIFALLLSAFAIPAAHAQLVVNGERDNSVSMPDVTPMDVGNLQQDENGFLTLPEDPSGNPLISPQQAQLNQEAQEKQAGQKQMANNPAQQIYRGDENVRPEAPRTHRMYEDNNFN